MADGKGRRWKNYMGLDKHDISIGGETLMERTVRLLHEADAEAELIITSHNKNLNIAGASRYEPKNNVLEIDRFTAELIGDNVCFLYGDVFYAEETISRIVNDSSDESVLFFGNEKSICAALVRDGELFKSYVEKIRKMFLDGEISECKGWQVYHMHAGLSLESREIGEHFVNVSNSTCDFNAPEDYEQFVSRK